MSEGAAVNVGAIMTSVHNGTHADAPFHFEKDGTTIDCLPLKTFIGRALVIDLALIFSTEAKPREISIADLEPFARDLTEAPRLLLKTGGGGIPLFSRPVSLFSRGRSGLAEGEGSHSDRSGFAFRGHD